MLGRIQNAPRLHGLGEERLITSASKSESRLQFTVATQITTLIFYTITSKNCISNGHSRRGHGSISRFAFPQTLSLNLRTNLLFSHRLSNRGSTVEGTYFALVATRENRAGLFYICPFPPVQHRARYGMEGGGGVKERLATWCPSEETRQFNYAGRLT